MQRQAIAVSGRLSPMPLFRAFWLGALALALVLVQALMAQARPESLAPLAEQISSSVVNITTSTVIEGRTRPSGHCARRLSVRRFFP